MNNPGEELNYHGLMNDSSSATFGANYGYPTCLAARDPTVLPDNNGMQVGTQFAYGPLGGNNTDEVCKTKQVPRLTFPAHTAPIDHKFTADGSALWVSFHGSWSVFLTYYPFMTDNSRNRQPPDGYRLSRVDFQNGEPVQLANSSTPAIDILTNPDNTKCFANCFRPTGLAFDAKGRLYMASDSTGEVFMITTNAVQTSGAARRYRNWFSI